MLNLFSKLTPYGWRTVDKKIKLLILIKPFYKKFPKQKSKYELFEVVQNYADVRYWHEDGDIAKILETLVFKPDFIFYFDPGWSYHYAPRIKGLDNIDIPKACLVIDTHVPSYKRKKFIEENKFDLIFSVTKQAFLTKFPEYREKFRWLPFSINPHIFKDYQQKKTIRYLLMGQFYSEGLKNPPKRIAPKGRYPFREAVFKKMYGKNIRGFVYHPHPGHAAKSKKSLINEKYALELNKAAIFFTCGGIFQYPVLKFFEALACHTLLIAETNPDIEELGFKDRVHFVACTKDDFYRKAKYFYKNKQRRQIIARNGYEFVHKFHTHEVRAKEFVDTLKEFLKSW